MICSFFKKIVPQIWQLDDGEIKYKNWTFECHFVNATGCYQVKCGLQQVVLATENADLWQVFYDASGVGNYNMSILLFGQNIQGSPFALRVEWGTLRCSALRSVLVRKEMLDTPIAWMMFQSP